MYMVVASFKERVQIPVIKRFGPDSTIKFVIFNKLQPVIETRGCVQMNVHVGSLSLERKANIYRDGSVQIPVIKRFDPDSTLRVRSSTKTLPVGVTT